MKKAAKTAFLYIGTAIGAGFSSGKEIALFFGKASPLNVAISSIFMSLLCCLFLIAGKQNMMPKSRLMGMGVFLSAAISTCSMLAGGEHILSSMTGVPLLGLLMAILAAITVSLGIEKIKLVNTVLVPLIVLCVAALFFKLGQQSYSLPFTILRPVMYSGLDVLLGGVVISEEGKKLSYKEIALSCAFICIILFVMLFMLQNVVLSDDLTSSMPVFAVSQKFRMQAFSGVLIASAIFTTLTSSLKIVVDKTLQAFVNSRRLSRFTSPQNRTFVIFFVLLLAYPISFWGFDNIVDSLYPFMSFCGILLTVLVVLKFCLKFILMFQRALYKSKMKQYLSRL